MTSSFQRSSYYLVPLVQTRAKLEDDGEGSRADSSVARGHLGSDPIFFLDPALCPYFLLWTECLFTTPQIHILKTMPQCDDIWMWGLGEVIKSRGQSPREWD